jgi:hypothetical protein
MAGHSLLLAFFSRNVKKKTVACRMCARFILRDREFLPLGTLRIGSSSLVCSYSWSTILLSFLAL